MKLNYLSLLSFGLKNRYKLIGIDSNRLFVTTFDGYDLFGKKIPADSESEKIWKKLIGNNENYCSESVKN